MPFSNYRALLLVTLSGTGGCIPAATFAVPAASPKTPPAVALDVHYPDGKFFTVTPAGQVPVMPVQLKGSEDLSLIAACTDDDGGCRNIQIFANVTTNDAVGSVQTSTGSPVVANLDANAQPGGTASQMRNAAVTLNVPQLRGAFVGLKLNLWARATNAHSEVTETKKVSLFWSRAAPLTLPTCPRFSPIGSAPPVVLDSRQVTVSLQELKAKDPTKTTFILGLLHPQNPLIGWKLTVEESGLAFNTAIFKFINNSGSDKELLTVDGRSCNAAGTLLQSKTGGPLQATVTTGNTTTILLSNPNMDDVAIWNEATFWPAFGGRTTTITWVQ